MARQSEVSSELNAKSQPESMLRSMLVTFLSCAHHFLVHFR